VGLFIASALLVVSIPLPFMLALMYAGGGWHDAGVTFFSWMLLPFYYWLPVGLVLFHWGGRRSGAIFRGILRVAAALFFVPLSCASGFISNSDVGGSCFGDFAFVTDRFLGARFLFKGETHYSWIQFRSVGCLSAELGGWAYETVPNRPIRAGDRGQEDSATLCLAEPTSLELLAVGSVAMTDWRRRRAE
jgi:hypothetical protein